MRSYPSRLSAENGGGKVNNDFELAALGEIRTVRDPGPHFRPAPLGCGLPRALRGLLASARRRNVGRDLCGDRLSAEPWRLVAKGLIPHGRNGYRSRSEPSANPFVKGCSV